MTTTAIHTVPVGTRIAILESASIDRNTGAVIEERREFVLTHLSPVSAADRAFALATNGYDYTGCLNVKLVAANVADIYTRKGKQLPAGSARVWPADRMVEVVK